VGPRHIGFVFLFSLFCILLGVLMAFVDLSGGAFTDLRNLLVENYFASRESRLLVELSSALPEEVAAFLYIVDKKLLFFGGVALFGTLMAILSVLRAGEISRDKVEADQTRKALPWKDWAKGMARLLVHATFLRKAQSRGLTRKMAGTLAGLTALVGLLVVGAVSYSIIGALLNQVNQRAFAIATNLSDSAAVHITAKNSLALHALLAKYALLEEVAYTFAESDKGVLLAHSLGKFPVELQGLLSETGLREKRWRTVTLGGQQVYEARVPILEGQLGAVHVGIWKAAVERDIRWALLPLIASVLIILLAGVTLAGFLVRKIDHSILRLAQIADRMSKGDLDTAVGVVSNDEIGELATSLERLRASLKAAMVRLDRRKIK